MKYEQQLKTRMIPSWHLYYMAYSHLKQLLKQKSDHWLIQDEEEFEYVLGSELSKVCRFLCHQLDRISGKTQQLEKQCQHQQQQRQRISATTTTTTTTEDNTVMDDTFATIVTELVFELHDTAQFLHANKTAFEKMVKKHDRYTSFSIRHRYNHLLATSSLDAYTQQLDSLMIRLCSLYDLCRQSRQQLDTTPIRPTSSDQSKQHEQHQQKLHCTTFWIHPDNINEVKAICLFHLSILSPNASYGMKESPTIISTSRQQQDKQQSNNITSIYLDNSNFDLYKKQVELCNDYNTMLLGQEALGTDDDWNSNRMVRCRWYGNDSSTMHLERQQHYSTGNQQQCMIDGITETSYLDTSQGNHTSATTRHLNNTFHQIQHSIRQQHLEPKCRTTCQRTSFQQQRGPTTTLRLHIDTNIKLTKISHGTSQKNQKTGVGDNKTHSFPYGLLTVHHHGNSMAPWLVQLLSSHLVYPVPRFSTFVHAISLFYGDQLALSFLSPWWILSVPKDIRKMPCNTIGLSRSTSARPLINGHRQSSFEQATVTAEEETSFGQHVIIPLTQSTPALDDHLKDSAHNDNSSACWWRIRRRRQQQHQHGLPTMSITDLSSTTIISKGKKRITTSTTPTTNNNNNKNNKNDGNKGKQYTNTLDENMKNNKMTEPKTYFANERTFISWLQFCAVLLTVALSLFNHGDMISRWMGTMFLSMTCLLTFYALGRFQYRSWQLRTRRYVLRYDDVFGPTVLCFFLVIAMMINIYLRLPLFAI